MKKKNTTKSKIDTYLNLKKGIAKQDLHLNSTAKKIMLATLPCITLGFGNINTLNAATSTRPVGATLSNIGLLAINIDNASGVDLSFQMAADGMGVRNGPAAAVHVHDTASNFFQRLGYGAAISTGGAFNVIVGGYQGITYNTTGCTGPWNPDGPGFLIVKFFISGQLHLGWLALQVTDKKDASGSCSGGSNQVGRKIKVIKAGWNTTSIGSGGTTINTSVVGSLPVELLSFKAKVENKQIQLRWNTASENDNAGFEIERSTNGRKYESLSFVEGNGNTTENQEYFYDDKDLVRGQLYYYRLKQIDYDGRFEYSKVITARLKAKNAQMSDFYPNPSKDGQTRLNYSTTKAGPLLIEIFDIGGQQLMTLHRTVSSGENTLNFDFAAIGRGLFFIKIEQNGDSNYQKLILE